MDTQSILSTLSPAGAGANSETAAERSATSIADTFDTFLSLLTTQLQNQDPLEPLDSNEFTQQLVEFTGVEQSIMANKNLEKVIENLAQNQVSQFVGYIGNHIDAAGDTTGLVDGKAEWQYHLGDDAAATDLAIMDSLGRIVWTAPGETTLGTHTLQWDGTDGLGNVLEGGAYTLVVSAMDFDETPIATDTAIRGRVTGATFADGQAQLLIGDHPVAIDAVTRVTAPATEKSEDSAEALVTDIISDL